MKMSFILLYILIGGSIAFTFLFAQGHEVGMSGKDLAYSDTIKEYIQLANEV